MQVTINTEKHQELGFLEPFIIDNLNIISCKNAALEDALKFYAGTLIADRLKYLSQFLSGTHRHQLVDVKYHSLKEGIVPCIPGWHVDGGPGVPSEYVLCVAGSSHTEFYTGNLTLSFNGNTKQFCRQMSTMIPGPTFALQDWQIVKYNHLAPHRGGSAEKAGPRLLLRLMESDTILPTPIGNWQPSYYKHNYEDQNVSRT